MCIMQANYAFTSKLYYYISMSLKLFPLQLNGSELFNLIESQIESFILCTGSINDKQIDIYIQYRFCETT